MQKVIFSLIAAAVLVAAAAKPGQTAGSSLDIANKSDKCVNIDIMYVNNSGVEDHHRTFMKPGETRHVYIWPQGTHGSPKVVADIEHCDSRQMIVRRYDYIPNQGASQLSIHNQGATVIMRHGP
jgi:hypothetical protein